MKTRLFSSHDIAHIVAAVGVDRLMDETIAGIEAACRSYVAEDYSIPVREGFSYDGEHTGLLEWMPVIEFRSQVLMKLVAYHPRNPQRHRLPTVLSTAMTFATSTGHATSIMDATFLTSLRTGAASAVASDILASPESKVLGLIGAGAQAVTQLHALSRKFQFERILVNDIDPKACHSFSGRARLAGVAAPIEIATLEHTVRAADLLCTATSIDVESGPLFDALDLKPALHINAVGSDFPGKTELPASLLRTGLVCPDFREQAMAEGECQQLSTDEIGPDLVTLVQNREEFERYRQKTTVFDSTGWAMEDYVAVELLAGHGANLGLGTQIELECLSDDPKDPYGFVESVLSRRARQSAEKLRRA